MNKPRTLFSAYSCVFILYCSYPSIYPAAVDPEKVIDAAQRLGAGPEGSPVDSKALRTHPFLACITWDTLWTDSPPPLESGLKRNVVPVGSVDSSDAGDGVDFRSQWGNMGAQWDALVDGSEDTDGLSWAADAEGPEYERSRRRAGQLLMRCDEGDEETEAGAVLRTLYLSDHSHGHAGGAAATVAANATSELDIRTEADLTPTMTLVPKSQMKCPQQGDSEAQTKGVTAPPPIAVPLSSSAPGSGASLGPETNSSKENFDEKVLDQNLAMEMARSSGVAESDCSRKWDEPVRSGKSNVTSLFGRTTDPRSDGERIRGRDPTLTPLQGRILPGSASVDWCVRFGQWSEFD